MTVADKLELWRRYFALARIPEQHQPQIVGALLSHLLPTGPYPVIVLNGEKGSAKSTTSDLLQNPVDPTRAKRRAMPDKEEDLIVAAKHSHVMSFDNLSGMSWKRSDLLCRIATGSTDGRREFYTREDENLTTLLRPLIINGIPDLATRGVLLDRAIVVTLPVIPPEERRTEEEIHCEAADLYPKILGILCDGIHAYLRNGPAVLPDKPRLADYFRMAEAAIAACGYPAGSVIGAYRATQDEIELDNLQKTATYRALCKRIKAGNCWEGGLGQLLDELRMLVHSADLRHLPDTPNGMETWIRRNGTALRLAGITANRHGKHKRTHQPWKIEREADLEETEDVGQNPPKAQARPAPFLPASKEEVARFAELLNLPA